MRKVRNAVSLLALSTAVLTGTATGAVAADRTETSPAVTGPCTVSGAFCATSDSGGDPIVLYCGMSAGVPVSWNGGGYWNNRLSGNGRVKMFGSKNTVIYTTPANYGPVRGDWGPVYSLRADC
ncbi:hypothetical protein [Streptomyces cinerochromogenes]|uniref:hypothetical protein n=1 Tax=Streptomyces cinerochromogenes TaxID=66422 RepID=UPI0016708110|nr:hypothetical protein [Streptomyces cinerochromogenes]GGS55094.1 hypothetical protein GCM10010206_16040 [Streptomyces cinerochromogenes]